MSNVSSENSANEHSRLDVWRMFDRIAPRYDLLNRLLSMRRDVVWRKEMARQLPEGHALRLLDLATGTADVLLSMMRNTSNITSGVGLDMSHQMLVRGKPKIASDSRLALMRSDATCIALPNRTFDAVTISFGIRNVLDVSAGLREMHRVLKPGGRALILEFSLPANALIRWGYLLYFRNVLPIVGGMISGDARAYRYLNETVETFPYGEAFCALMRDAGLVDVQAKPLTFGIATLYRGDRPSEAD